MLLDFLQSRVFSLWLTAKCCLMVFLFTLILFFPAFWNYFHSHPHSCNLILPCAITHSVTCSSLSLRRPWHQVFCPFERWHHILMHALQLIPPCLEGGHNLSSCLRLCCPPKHLLSSSSPVIILFLMCLRFLPHPLVYHNLARASDP